MSSKIFLGSKFKSLKADGSVNASGTAEFFEIGGTFSTYKSTYSNSGLTVANSNIITLDAAGEADIWLNGDYDVRIKDSSGTTLDTFLGINPADTTESSSDNLISNPSFESDANADLLPDDWDVTTYTGGTATIDSADRSRGTNSMKFVTTGNGGGTITTSSYSPVPAGGVLKWSFWLKSTADVRNLAQILWYDASKVALGSPSTDIFDDSTTNPTSWTLKQGAVTIPSTAYFCKFKFFGGHSSDASSGTIRIDNVNLSDISTSAEGPDIVAAATTNVWDGYFTKHITGTTTITSFGTASYAGQMVKLIFDSALTLTHSSNLNLPSAANIIVSAGDYCVVRADTTTQHDVISYTRVGSEPYFAVKGTDIASATTTDLSAATGKFVDVTGTTTITALGTATAGTERTVRFTGSLTLTHNATSLQLPGSVNIGTSNGDVAEFVSLGSGNWKCKSYITTAVSPPVFLYMNTVGTAVTGNVSSVDQATEIITWSTTHGLSTGDVIYRTGGTWPNIGGVAFTGAAYVRALSTTTFATYRTLANAQADTSRDNYNSAGSGNGTMSKMPPTTQKYSGISAPTNYGTLAATDLNFSSIAVSFTSAQPDANYGILTYYEASGAYAFNTVSSRATTGVTISLPPLAFGTATHYLYFKIVP